MSNENITMIILKPRTLMRGLVGQVLNRFESAGFDILDIKLLDKPLAFWDAFYPSDIEWMTNAGVKTLGNTEETRRITEESFGTTDPVSIGQAIKHRLRIQMSSSPSIAVLLGGERALKRVKEMCGATLPDMAKPGTIRRDFSDDTRVKSLAEKRAIDNVIHACDPDEQRHNLPAYVYEISLVFSNAKV